ncbi:hypothetical protein [Arthrobacter sp. RCC_34]|uniref:hypothetical protein n=1 Tax=Arthrobacter sp. RCC_34 TaxID=3239230 RepID=UPI00352369C7
MTEPTEGKSVDQAPSPWTRPWFLASAAVVAILVALLVLYFVLPSPSATPGPSPSPSAAGTGTAQAGQESACGLPAGDQRLPSVGLPTKWELLGRVAVPTDPKVIGPGKINGNVRTCYQHSPTGALYAAANFMGTGLLPGGQAIVLKNLTAKSPMQEQALATKAPQTAEDPSLSTKIAGFRVLAYTGSAARFSVAVEVTKDGRSAYGSMDVGLRWEGGDWKIVMEETSTTMAKLDDLSDFVPWAGV